MQLEEKIARLLNNELGEIDRQALFQEIEKDDLAKEIYITQKNLWVKSGLTSSVIKSKIEFKEDYKELKQKINSNRFVIKRLNSFLRYAAVAVLMISIGTSGGYFLHKSRMSSVSSTESVYTFYAGNSSITEVDLPDGSKIALNANTTLLYIDKGAERYVKLEGEALFEVVHDETKPFVIETGGLKVVDVGTVFNVKSYPKDDFVKTTLLEGIVDLFVDEQHRSTLKPRQTAIFHKLKKEIDVTTGENRNVIAWKDNRFIYKEETLEIIINDLINWYGITSLEWGERVSKDELLTINIQRAKSINQVLEVLALTSEFKYTIARKDGSDVLIIK